MKKLILIISSLIIAISNLDAQTSIELTNNSTGIVITNNSDILEDVATGGQSHVYIQLKNISSSTVTYAVKKTEILINSGADAYFCWGGQCFPTTTTVTPAANYKTLAAGEVYAPQSFYYDENVAAGYSEIKYEIYNINNPNDAIAFTFKFNPTLTSIKNNSLHVASISDVYPNPAVNKAQLLINCNSIGNNAVINITNALGSVVISKNIELSLGKNAVVLDTESLTSGVYFATILTNNTKTIKKFTINK
jgi:hypothetical protein